MITFDFINEQPKRLVKRIRYGDREHRLDVVAPSGEAKCADRPNGDGCGGGTETREKHERHTRLQGPFWQNRIPFREV